MDRLDSYIKESVARKTKNFLEEKKDSADKQAYQEFFASMLKKFNVKSPDDLKGQAKQKFFDAVDAGWKSEKEISKKKA